MARKSKKATPSHAEAAILRNASSGGQMPGRQEDSAGALSSNDGTRSVGKSPGTVRKPLRILLASLVKLGDNVAVAFDSHLDRGDIPYERARYIHALCAMSDFLRANNAPLRYAQRLNRLALVLSDLNEGKTDPLVAQTSFGSVNPGDTTLEWIGRANAALGMAALVAAAAKRSRAAETAQSKIGGDVEAKTCLSCHDQFRASTEKSKIKNSLARAHFDNGRSLIDPKITPAAAKKLANYFFALAATQLRKQV